MFQFSVTEIQPDNFPGSYQIPGQMRDKRLEHTQVSGDSCKGALFYSSVEIVNKSEEAVCDCMHLCECVFWLMSSCFCMRVFVFLGTYLCLCICLHASMRVFEYVCASMHLWFP